MREAALVGVTDESEQRQNKRISYIHSKVFPEKTLQDRVYDVYPAFLTAFRLFEQTHIRL